MINFLARLFGFASESSESSDSEVVSTCPLCSSPIGSCRCCYSCGAAERTTCNCAMARADAALQELVDELDSQPGGSS